MPRSSTLREKRATIDRTAALLKLYQMVEVSYDTALSHARHPDNLKERGAA